MQGKCSLLEKTDQYTFLFPIETQQVWILIPGPLVTTGDFCLFIHNIRYLDLVVALGTVDYWTSCSSIIFYMIYLHASYF